MARTTDLPAAHPLPAHLPGGDDDFSPVYARACELAIAGAIDRSREELVRASRYASGRQRSILANDQAVLLALEGKREEALELLARLAADDPGNAVALANLQQLQYGNSRAASAGLDAERPNGAPQHAASHRIKVAVLSFLFNWPSTGGGIVHTVELCRFLAQAGYDIRHFHARYAPWRIGVVEEGLPFPSEPLGFDASDWNVPGIQARFRNRIDAFDPDYVIITDSWNMKPLLAESVAQYPYILRQQALECLCPLNNLRLLCEGGGSVRQCPRHQLATPDACCECLLRHGPRSGSLHQAERALAGVGAPGYYASLRRALSQANAVLVLNPLAQAMLSPYAPDVRVVTWGMDRARFPWPWPADPCPPADKTRTTLLMAGVAEEFIKGYHVLEEACARLWQRRQDFELLVTAEPAGHRNAFTRNIGWIPQRDLPRQLRAADILVMPTIAQEGLGRTTVEAMGVGRPVVASRIGGLPYTVQDGATGLLCEPGNAQDLAAKIEALLDDPERRERMGLLGRRRFEEQFPWDVVIERDYRPLLRQRRVRHHR